MVDCAKCKNFVEKQDARGMYCECLKDLFLEKENFKQEFPTECACFELKGLKYDEGKNRMGLMCEGFSRALWEVARVSTFGANRYGANNWQHLKNPKERYMDALCRHLFQHLQGKKVDDESGLLHLQHMCWNALALLEFELEGKIDFKYKAPIDHVNDYIKTEEGAKKIMEIAKESEEEND